MDKQKVAYLCNEILFLLIKEGHSDMWHSMNELEIIMLSEISQVQKDKYNVIPLL